MHCIRWIESSYAEYPKKHIMKFSISPLDFKFINVTISCSELWARKRLKEWTSVLKKWQWWVELIASPHIYISFRSQRHIKKMQSHLILSWELFQKICKTLQKLIYLIYILFGNYDLFYTTNSIFKTKSKPHIYINLT